MKKKSSSKIFLYFFVVLIIGFSLIITVKTQNNQSGIPTGGAHIQFQENNPSNIPTGNTHIQFQENPSRFAYTLENWMNNFFEIDGITFPKGYCANIAKELLSTQIKKKLQVTEDFTTTGSQRVSTRMFGIDQEYVGALEMIYGKELVNKNTTESILKKYHVEIINKDEIDSVLNFWSETIVKLPHLERTTEIEVTLFGVSKDKFKVTLGRLTTPILDCLFITKEDGSADCNCKIKRTHDYVNE